ncbi:MAG: hypothetical protein OQJ96_12155 [Flavobacteriales bacterium]|nr:hypothetical protein [Flavobacteriales bacterium]MCW8913264.1 hypothetical protein [Flavobacteriales bacterium]MCW8938956.1 hypothetical protein [Flavobacteriales bacterium]MCW8939419.1 hypothetical protein [Flavobacteriales bacterium]MCW8968208.1 hypothetical protein [Flavobacteriales bacterium]
MARSIKKLSSFDKKIQKEIAELIEADDIKMVDFPYKGEIERGIIWKINEEDSYLVVLDNFKSAVKLVETDDDDEDEDDDTPEEVDDFDGINEEVDVDEDEDDDFDKEEDTEEDEED